MSCGDCGCYEGELHEDYCDQERCPICKGQLLSCDCDKSKITDEMREPYFETVFCCARCGKTMPSMIMVSDGMWKFICGATYSLTCVLCSDCMKYIYDKRIKLKGDDNAKGKK